MGVYHRLISMIPPHRVYIEACLGGGAILRHKRPSKISLAFDPDAAALDAFDQVGLKAQGVSVWVLKESHFSNKAYLDLWDLSPHPTVALIQGDVLQKIWNYRRLLNEHCFVYFDPPYLRSTRRSKRPLYQYEWSDEQHLRMLELAKSLRAKVMISGYWSEMYAQALQGWRVVSFDAQTRQGPATEFVWMNYPEPNQLHDYRYLGRDWVDRQRIRRKATRWLEKLKKLPPNERYAILDVLNTYLQTPQSGLSSPARGPLDTPDYEGPTSQEYLGLPVFTAEKECL